MTYQNYANKNIIRIWLMQLGFAGLYLFSGLFIQHYVTNYESVNIFWLGGGMALAAMLLGGKRYIWGVLLGSLLLNSLLYSSPWIAGSLTLSSALGPLLGVLLLMRYGQALLFLDSLPSYLRLIALGGGTVCTVSAIIGPLTLLLAGSIPMIDYWRSVFHWWIQGLLGVVLITPLILAWRQTELRPFTRKLKIEVLLIIVCTFLAGQFVFLGWLSEYLSDTPIGYIMFSFVAWIAIRLGSRWVTFILLMVAIQALLGAQLEMGFFKHDITRASLENYWIYMLILSVVGMAISTNTKAVKSALGLLQLKDRALNAAANGIMITDVTGRVEWANDAAIRNTGFNRSEVYGHNVGELTKSGKHDKHFYKTMWDTLMANKVWHGEVINRRKDGSLYDEEITITPVSNGLGTITHFVSLKQDITLQKKAEEKLKLAASVFAHAHEGILITEPDGKIIDVNNTFCQITGYSRDEVVGRNPRLLSSGRQGKEHYSSMFQQLMKSGHWSGEIWNRRKSGEIFATMQTISVVYDAQNNIKHYVSLFSDITLLKEHAKQLEHTAYYDALTSLPNRVLLSDRMRQAMMRVHRHSQQLAVVFLDLDGFKAINDTHGHAAGDQLLISLANSIKRSLREGDTLARIGGDEFVIVLPDLDGSAASVPMLNRLLTAAAEPIKVNEAILQISASIGVTFYPQAEDLDADQLLRQADQAMYLAKQAGKNRYHIFDAYQDSCVRGVFECLDSIQLALKTREFVLFYQPKVNMRTGVVIGAEALIRWQHPEQGLLPPAAFLPMVENHPLAIEIGEWVIESALTQMELWCAAGLDIPISVNIGAHQLQQADFAERLRILLAAHPKVMPSCLELEILETSALEDVDKVSQTMETCQQLGVSFALDDFGTGYSSLTYLKHLPVNLLKIDQSFVRDMLNDQDDLAILEGIIGLGTAFRRKVIAEGVETIEHGEMLLQLGCELAQGYGIARPMPACEIPGWASSWLPDPRWINESALNLRDLPLLHAIVEHRAWITAIKNYLDGKRQLPPPIDCHQCRFGQWMDTEGTIRYAALPIFRSIESLHLQVHAEAAELLELYDDEWNAEALAKLDELYSLSDALIKQLERLVLAIDVRPASLEVTQRVN